MKKIGRNEPCYCGSGKKYKHCHINNDNSSNNNTESSSNKSGFDKLIEKYNSIQILGLLAALQLNPVNHGRNYRFEQMSREVLLQFNPDDERPLASWEKLKSVIEDYQEGKGYEDPLTNAFSETAIFEEGNYIVYSGIYAGFTQILNQLTECIFLQKNNLDTDFIKICRDAIGILLLISNSAAKDAGHSSYMYQESVTGNIEFLEYEKAVQYNEAIYFSKGFLEDVCNKRRYKYSILQDFLLVLGSEELLDDDPENNVVNFKPLIEVEGSIILYMPTGIVHALINFIYKKAKEYNCYDELLDSMYERQFHLSCLALSKANWLATDIKLPPQNPKLPMKETVFQFDNQKLAYVCFIEAGKEIVKSENQQEIGDNPYNNRAVLVEGYLSSISSEQQMSIFCLYIIAEVAQDFYFMWAKPSIGNQSLALTCQELLTITHSEEMDSLSLWKFAKCYSRTNELARIMSFGGTMDAYSIYRKNKGSLLNSDEKNPFGGMLMIVNGSSDDFKREVQKQQNEHAVPIFYNGKLAYAKVTRYKNYAPIYVEREISKNLRLVVENYKMPIWITSGQSKAKGESMGGFICEAVAFWLNKMQRTLTLFLDKQSFIQFELDIVLDEKLLEAEEFEIIDFNIEYIKIACEVVAPVIKLTIPFEFIYAIFLPDNTADKILMTAVLNGIELYIKTAGKDTELTDETVAAIVEQTLKPSYAKMILFSDASANIKMDNRNLPPLRYIRETDISYILDNLVSYLPGDYKIPNKIADKAVKIKLCDDIVSALIIQITNRIKEFDGPELLKWLVKMNEKCIQVREFREIVIPAKIACFSSMESEIEELLDKENNLVTTGHATRTLIEFISTNMPSGTKWSNFDDIDELLALTNQLTEWGALSEAMRMNLDNPEMGLLLSGRIGTEKTIEREAFKPYAVARSESEIFKNVENFEKNYVPIRTKVKAEETDESKCLDSAFKSEFNITLTTLSKIIGVLINESFTRIESCRKIEKDELIAVLEKIEGISSEDVKTTIELLTLLERTGIGKPPSGYTSVDIFPWRYNRPLSYLRKPLVKVSENGNEFYYYGYRHLMAYIDNLLFLLHSGKLPNPKSDEMKSWLAGVSGDKGTPFRKQVKEWFEKETDFRVISYEVKMDSNVSAGHIKTDKQYGDIDLLVIDHANRVIYPIECKNITGGRNVHEMKVEMDDYLGRDGNDKKAKIKKHAERHKWLTENKASLSQFVSEIKNYSITSLILTADEIPLAYLKRNSLPLPVKSFVFLRKHGATYLS
jgi:hypothetical protein